MITRPYTKLNKHPCVSSHKVSGQMMRSTPPVLDTPPESGSSKVGGADSTAGSKHLYRQDSDYGMILLEYGMD